MTNPIQLLRDFRKWRKERYENALREVKENIAEEEYNSNHYLSECVAYHRGLRYGIEHRKEILKKVKIWI